MTQNHKTQPTGGLAEPIVIEVGPAWARLAAPRLPELAGLVGAQLPPWQLLQRLAAAGLNLLPDSSRSGGAGALEAAAAVSVVGKDSGGGRGCKDVAMEMAICRDVSRIW